MIDLTSALTRTPTAVLDQPGGFAWWYLDLVDDAGNGVVLIWSWGLPFLPGYLDAARRQKAQQPRSRPALSVASFRAGKPDAYLLREFEPGQAEWHLRGDAQSWRFGESRIEQRIEAGQVTMTASLRTHVVGTGLLEGTVELHGAAAGQADATPPDAPHVWGPVAPHARAHAELSWGGVRLEVTGRGYHDRNWGWRPLDALGIRRWLWLRASTADETCILYLLEPTTGAAPQALVLRHTAAGDTDVHTAAAVHLQGTRRDLFGLSLPRTVRVDLDGGPWTVALGAPVDRGPFYLRAPVTAQRGGVTSTGVAECVEPGRIDLDRHRPLISMAVQRPRANSLWLPLFSGPRATRLSRLLRGHALDPGTP